MVGVLNLHSVVGKFLRYPALRATLRAFIPVYNLVSSNWHIFDETFFFC